MRTLLLTVTFCLGAMALQAQNTSTTIAAPPAVQKDASTTEMRAMSGTLKETLGQVSQMKGMVTQWLADPAMADRAPKLEASSNELGALSSDIESMLGEVNTAKPDTWSTIKVKAEALNTRAQETMSTAKQLSVAGK